VAYQIDNVYAIRMAAVFMISTRTLAIRMRLLIISGCSANLKSATILNERNIAVRHVEAG
jgi:hypothetical protein